LDIIYPVAIQTKSSDGISKTEFTELPSSLFEQARTGQKIYFSRNGSSFALELAPTIQYKQIGPLESLGGPPIKTTAVPFDDYAKSIAASALKREFRTFGDIPNDYFAIYLHNLSKPGNLGRTFCSFSPRTTCIHLSQVGVKSLNRDALNLFEFELTNEIAGTIHASVHKEDTKSFTVKLSSIGCLNSNIEILLDQSELYVMMNRTKFLSSPCGNQRFFCQKSLSSKWLNIDTSRVTAINNTRGILEIRFPFIKKEAC
jgi:hypothetical protein